MTPEPTPLTGADATHLANSVTPRPGWGEVLRTYLEPASLRMFALGFSAGLPNLLVFDEELQARRDAELHLLLALAHHGLGETNAASSALAKTLAFTCADQGAADLQRKLDSKPHH